MGEKKHSSREVHVYYHRRIWPISLRTIPVIGREGGGGSSPNLPQQPLLIWHTTCSTLLTLIRRVAVRSDSRCRLCVSVCVIGGEGATELRKKKKKKTPKYLFLALCRNISEPAPPNTKTGSTRVQALRPRLLTTTSPGRRHVVTSKKGLDHAPYFLVLLWRWQRPPAGSTLPINTWCCEEGLLSIYVLQFLVSYDLSSLYES